IGLTRVKAFKRFSVHLNSLKKRPTLSTLRTFSLAWLRCGSHHPDKARQLAEGLHPKLFRTEALGLCKLGRRAENHAQYHRRRSVGFLEDSPGIGVFGPVFFPQ